MTRSTWMVIGSGPDTRVIECHPGKGKDDRRSYGEAKVEALVRLEAFVCPYLRRIEELKQDEFKERGKLPKFRAWYHSDRLIVAKSQKRAAELLRTNTYDIRTYYQLANGDWWYRYAETESIWIEVRDERGRGTGEFQKALSSDEAKAMLHEEVARFETMPLAQLAQVVGHDEVVERECSNGYPISVVISVRRYDREPSVIRVEGEIRDRVLFRESVSVERDIESEQPACNWKEVGF